MKDPAAMPVTRAEPPPPTAPEPPLETVTARRMKTALADKPQSVMFVKTEASTAKRQWSVSF